MIMNKIIITFLATTFQCILFASAAVLPANSLNKRDVPLSTVNQALILSRPNEESLAASTLQQYGVPYSVITVPDTGIPSLNLELNATAGNFSMVIMTSSLFSTINGLWQSALTPAQLAVLDSYLAKYNARLVRLADSPDASTGVDNVLPVGAQWAGTGAVQSITVAPSQTLVSAAGFSPNTYFSSEGIWHYPGSITNSTLATPILNFQPVNPEFPTQTTVAAALINSPKGFSMLSFYMAWSSTHPTCVSLGALWLTWVSKGAYPVKASTLASFQVDQRILIVSLETDDHKAISLILEGYSVPFDLFISGKSALKLEVTPNSHGAYSAIVMTTKSSSLQANEWSMINTYLSTYSARLVQVNDVPDPTTGVAPAFPGTDNGQRIYFAPEGLPIAQASGLQPTLALGTKGLFHYPAKIIDTNLATPVFLFEPLGNVNIPTVAAAVLKKQGYLQLSFYFGLGWWSTNSAIISHAWFHWATKGFYTGYRRLILSTQIDDVFLSTETNSSEPAYRLTGADMIAVEKWQKDVTKRMNPGSKFVTEIAFNGNGVWEQTWKAQGGDAGKATTVAPLFLPDEYLEGVDINFIKPLGTGMTVWPKETSSLSVANMTKIVPTLRKYDSLYDYFYVNASEFFMSSHTFTHEILNNCSYSDAYNELTTNRNFAQASGWTGKPFWSNFSMVTTGISGIWNGDAIRAMFDSGIFSIVGDTS
ncbi:hypothetical protein HDV05_007446, partial [Chytridiales sp. JEL 0842]